MKKSIDIDDLTDREAAALLAIERKRRRARAYYARNKERINNKRRATYRRVKEVVDRLEDDGAQG